jgi:transposase
MVTDVARDYFVDTEVARMLGVNAVTVRQWRVKNKKAGELRFGPPYEIRGSSVVYPKEKFREWCAAAPVVNGVPRLNLPVTADVTAIQQATAKVDQDVFAQIGRLAA